MALARPASFVELSVHFALPKLQDNRAMTHPLVSVAIPAYNASRYIAETLDSLLSQRYPHVEVIVVDDGSTDNTAEALRPYMECIVYHRQSNAGLGAARNAGMRLARGEFIAWCDADDICETDRLLTQVAYLAHNPAAVAVGSNFAAFDGESRVFDPAHAKSYYSELAQHGLAGIFPNCEDFDGRTVEWIAPPLAQTCKVYWGDAWQRLLLGNFMHPPTMMMRAKVREQVGWLQEDLRKTEDWEYITRIARCGAIAFIDAPLLRYRCHPGQMSFNRSMVGPLSWIRVLESHRRMCSNVRADLVREFDSRLAQAHADASIHFAAHDKQRALHHLLTALRLDPSESQFLHHLALILAPASVLGMYRKLRSLGGDEAMRRSSSEHQR
jgi:glycosyltransferase involved in cell wall biosynthesis